MSTKTTFKRVALVAVVALGFGTLSSFAPASAASASGDTIYNVPVTITNSNTTLAGRVGQQVSIAVTGTWTTDAGSAATTIPGISVATAITSQPATSTVYPTITGVGSAPATNIGFGGYGLVQSGSTVANIAASSMTGTSSTVATVNYNTDTKATAATGATNATLGTVTFTPTVADTYSLVVWNENDRTYPTSNAAGFVFTSTSQASLSGSESFKVFTINVSAGVSTVTLTAQNSTAAVSGANGSLIKVGLKDAAGNAAILAPGETITLTPSGSGDIAAVNGVAVTSAAGASDNLASSAA